jgi:adenylate kinase
MFVCYTVDMLKKTIIFIGASGSGKGTQVELVKQELKKRDSETPIFYLQTGQLFREFIKGDTFAAREAKAEVERGELLPGFVAMWMWSDTFMKNLTGGEHLILDGSPRTTDEVHHLDIAMRFFRREQPSVIYINVSNKWSTERLLERAKKEGRTDDQAEGIKKRLGWFERDVVPAIDLYRRDRQYDFFEINGERSVEDVHADIMAKVFGDE